MNSDRNTSISTLGEKSLKEETPSLYKHLADNFMIGAAVEPYQIAGIHSELLKKHFNSIVAENVMKPLLLAPNEDEFDWVAADQIVQFAKENNMQIRFHTLVWHNQTPDWFFKDKLGNDMTPTPENKQLLLERLKQYIRTVGERYKNDMESWDVVNEVIDPEQPDGLRRSKWFEITGTDYMKTAFYTAREVLGHDAKLFINDYSTNDPIKREKLYELVTNLLDKGVPIDGVGHQMHINSEWPTLSTISETIDMFSDLGLDNKITEMDVSIYTNETDKYDDVPEEVLVKQGYRFKELFDLFKQKQEKISQVITWGIGDDHTWKKTFRVHRTDLPLFFDEQLQPKHAFWGVVDSSKLP